MHLTRLLLVIWLGSGSAFTMLVGVCYLISEGIPRSRDDFKDLLIYFLAVQFLWPVLPFAFGLWKFDEWRKERARLEKKKKLEFVRTILTLCRDSR